MNKQGKITTSVLLAILLVVVIILIATGYFTDLAAEERMELQEEMGCRNFLNEDDCVASECLWMEGECRGEEDGS